MDAATGIVLATWRAVLKDLERTPEGSPERLSLEREASRLRDEYNRLVALVLDPAPAPVTNPPKDNVLPG
jgi:hypothetical protein